ncbi:MAG: glutaredoxin family protein [Candidatus Binatia bacterium]
MSRRLTLYTRAGCCLCDEMKAALGRAAAEFPFALEEIDVDSAPDLQEKYGREVPVLLIDGRKAFKYRVADEELRRRLKNQR